MKPFLAAFRVQARYWLRHRVQALLCLSGIVLGVAVFIAIQLANRGALKAFHQGVSAFAGAATHRVFAPAGGGVPESLYPALLTLPEVRAAAPLLRGRLVLSGAGRTKLTVLGIDPISDAEFRSFDFVSGSGAEAASGRLLERFLAEPDAVVVPTALGRQLDLSPGAELEVATPTGPRTLRVLAWFDPPSGQVSAFSRTVVVDVAAFQELFDSLGRLDSVRLIIEPGGADAVATALPDGVTLEPAGGQANRVDLMSRAFRLNLETLGGFALLVAMFLIFNAASFSVVQRERTVAMLRCIGANTRTVFAALLAEAVLIGTIGALLGVLLGRALGAVMLRNTGATLFEVVLQAEAQPASVALDAQSWLIGLVLGVGVSVLGALVPARQGARVSPLSAVRSGRVQAEQVAGIAGWALLGLVLLALAFGLLWVPGRSLVFGLLAGTLTALGMACLCPLAVQGASWVLARPLAAILGMPARLAARNLGRSVARTGVAAASLMIALSLALAIGINVRSFKRTMEVWLEQVVTADFYMGPAPGQGARMDADLIEGFRDLPFVSDVARLRTRRIVLGDREILVLGLDLPAYARHATIPPVDQSVQSAYAELERGAAYLSETLAYPLGLSKGDTIVLPGVQGEIPVRVGAVVQNYSAPQGLLYLSLDRYAELFGAAAPGEAAIWLKPGEDASAALAALERLPGMERVAIIPNGALRGEALRVLARTFVITDLMGVLAAFVAFMAVVSALTALLEARLRSLGYLRAIGVSRMQLGLSLALEAGLLAATAAVVSWIAGVILAWVIVYVINRRAFGWTLQFLPEEGSYVSLLLLAIVAALLGSAWPIWRATRHSIVGTIREE